MLDKPDDAVRTLQRNSKYAGRDLDAMIAIADAANRRSFSSFNKVWYFRKSHGCSLLFRATLFKPLRGLGVR
jgi:hypothetical protein